MACHINADRGYHMRSHPTLGMDIFMYVDDPGVYLTAHCDRVDEALAEAAGFPVAKHKKEHEIKYALAAAHKAVLEKYGAAKPKFFMERGEFKIMDIGMDRYNVLSGDEVLNKDPIPKEEAMMLLDHLSPMPKDV